MKSLSPLLIAPLLLIGLVACGPEPDNGAEQERPRGTTITAEAVTIDTVRITEETLGTVRTTAAPTVAAEVAARIVEIMVDEGDAVAAGELLARLDDGDFRLAAQRARAEISRLEALIENQQRQVTRNRQLLERNMVSESDLDNALAELRALEGQLASTRAELAQAERNIERTRVKAPVDGRVESREADVGGWAGQGTPLFRISTDRLLRAQLPFPEYVADRLRTGLTVELISPVARDQQVDGTITEIRPMLGSSTRSVMIIAEFDNPGGWRPGASVNGRVVLETREEALLVPDMSIVLRPAGSVVYVIENDTARQRVVRTGVRTNGMIEVLDGLEAGERVAVDGAGFLTDGAPVNVPEPD
ncbi:efflux RND transporter periplasmic adaptor subunit [Thioalkalivibrio thiocyanodenitrificans]|uniref:efflux RND transporter periplasmic adaptor subunit n=1 Tax=Thioalkalivibrio thiocyanodenitrificans TaxID=243063 RepID=UPI00037E9EE9|nr:efflux RND transporter periplasmic adaptor subunit [Thioalkalivibrio thiocyanodenitrificans]